MQNTPVDDVLALMDPLTHEVGRPVGRLLNDIPDTRALPGFVPPAYPGFRVVDRNGVKFKNADVLPFVSQPRPDLGSRLNAYMDEQRRAIESGAIPRWMEVIGYVADDDDELDEDELSSDQVSALANLKQTQRKKNKRRKQEDDE
jgi:hypothetical protein